MWAGWGIILLCSLSYCYYFHIFHPEVPFSAFSVNITSTGTPYTLQALTLTCVTALPLAVDAPLQISHQWRRFGSVVSNDSRVILSVVSHLVNTSKVVYISTLTFLSLLSSDSGIYTCTSIVQPQPSLEFDEENSTQLVATTYVTIGRF